MVQTKSKIEASKRVQVAAQLIVLVLITCTLVALSYNLDSPGLQYDESLFINGSLGFKFKWMNSGDLFGIPTFVFPYIGSLKSILYSPFFHLFGINAYTIRLPSLIIGLVAIYSPLLCLKSQLSPYRVFIYFALPGSCINLLLLTRNDWGPVAISLLLTSFLYILLFLNDIPLTRRKNLFLISLLSLLLVFNKLDGLFPITSIASVYILSKLNLSSLSLKARIDSINIIAIKKFIIAITPAYIFFAFRFAHIRMTVNTLSNNTSNRPFVQYLQESIFSVLNPYQLTGYFYDNPEEFQIFHKFILILLASVTFVIIFSKKNDAAITPKNRFNLSSTSKKLLANSLILTLIIYLSPLQTSTHHYYMIGFSLLLSISFGLMYINQYPISSILYLNKIVTPLIVLLLSANITFNLIGTSFHLKNIHMGNYSRIWNNEIYTLSSSLEQMLKSKTNYVSAFYIDWGFINQIESLNAFKINLDNYYSQEIHESLDDIPIEYALTLHQTQVKDEQTKLSHYMVFIGNNKPFNMGSLFDQQKSCYVAYEEQFEQLTHKINATLKSDSSLIMRHSHVCTFLIEDLS